jgi:hypothetical protein
VTRIVKLHDTYDKKDEQALKSAMNDDQPLSALSSDIGSQLGVLLAQFKLSQLDVKYHTSLLDILQRFKIWSGNIGALRPPDDPRSLESRVRGSAELRGRFVQLLGDVKVDLDDCKLNDIRLKTPQANFCLT